MRGQQGGTGLGRVAGGRPAAGVLRESTFHDLPQGFGKTAEVGLLHHDAIRNDVRRAAAKRVASGGGVGDEGAPGEDVPAWSRGARAVVLRADPPGGSRSAASGPGAPHRASALISTWSAHCGLA